MFDFIKTQNTTTSLKFLFIYTMYYTYIHIGRARQTVINNKIVKLFAFIPFFLSPFASNIECACLLKMDRLLDVSRHIDIMFLHFDQYLRYLSKYILHFEAIEHCARTFI